MEPKIDEQKAKFMRMTAMDDGKLIKILVKLKEESEASQLVNVLQKEVEALS
jgi:capsular polysaccharide biosynthesis protein